MKKIKEFLSKYQLIIVLALIAGLIAGYKLLFIDKQESIEPNISPTPIPTSSPAPTEQPAFPTDAPDASYVPNEEVIETIQKQKDKANENYPLWEQLPYKQDTYIISHYVEPLTLLIKIDQGTNQNLIEQEVINWIEKQDINPKSHLLKWEYK